MIPMLDYFTNALQEASTKPIGLLLAITLGFLGSVTTACCTLPVIGVLIGYSGAQENISRKLALKKALFFNVGIIFSLMLLGAVAGFVGQVAQFSLGQYWKIFAGVMLIFFGLVTLKLLPFNPSFVKLENIKTKLGMSGVILTGLVLGGLFATSTLCCNPAIFIVVGVATLQRQIIQAVLILGMYAVGFSLPIGAIIFGVSVSKASFLPKSADKFIRWIAGGIQLIVGFYFLVTL
jgi:cytochrome c biogenesis protein CcdA